MGLNIKFYECERTKVKVAPNMWVEVRGGSTTLTIYLRNRGG